MEEPRFEEMKASEPPVSADQVPVLPKEAQGRPVSGPLRIEVKAFVAVVIIFSFLVLEPWSLLFGMKPWYRIPDPRESGVFWKLSMRPVVLGIELLDMRPFGRRRYGHSRIKACIANMRTLEGALEMYDMDSTGRFPAVARMPLTADSGVGKALVKDKYIKSMPICKSNGVYSVINFPDATEVECNYHGTVATPNEESEQLASGSYTKLPRGSRGVESDLLNTVCIWLVFAWHICFLWIPFAVSRDPVGGLWAFLRRLVGLTIMPLTGFFLLISGNGRSRDTTPPASPGSLARGLVTPLRKIAVGLAVPISSLLLLGPFLMFTLPYTGWVILRYSGKAQRACDAAGPGWRNPWFGRASLSVMAALFGVFLLAMNAVVIKAGSGRLEEIAVSQIAFWTIGAIACALAALSRTRAQSAAVSRSSLAAQASAALPVNRPEMSGTAPEEGRKGWRLPVSFDTGDAMIITLAGFLVMVMRNEMFRNRETVFFNSAVLMAGLLALSLKAFEVSSASVSRPWTRLAADSLGCLAAWAFFLHGGYVLGLSRDWMTNSLLVFALLVVHYFFWSIGHFRDAELLGTGSNTGGEPCLAGSSRSFDSPSTKRYGEVAGSLLIVVRAAIAVVILLSLPGFTAMVQGRLLIWGVGGKHWDTVVYLLEKGVAPGDEALWFYKAIPAAVEADQSECLMAMLKRSNGQPGRYSSFEGKPLDILCAEKNSVKCLESLLKDGLKVTGRTQPPYHPAFAAAANGSAEALGLLLKHCPTPDSPITPDGKTPLYAAVEAGQAECVKILLAAGADPSRLNDLKGKPRIDPSKVSEEVHRLLERAGR